MGAIFGFTGPPSPEILAHMRSQLKHRGTEFRSIERPHASVGALASDHETPRQRHLSGWCKGAGDRVVVINGFLTSHASTSDGQVPLCASVDESDFASGWEGDFVAAVVDSTGIRLVRDAAGARSVYWAHVGPRWVFASEPKAIWSLPGFSRSLAPQALVQYLTFSFVPGPGTMLHGIHALQAGHLLNMPVGRRPTTSRYFEFERCEPPRDTRDHRDAGAQVDATHWVNNFRRRFRESVMQRLSDQNPPVVFLSGGLDSSVVTAELVKQVPKLKTFALHFGSEYKNELAYAAAVAQRCSTDHHEVLIRPTDFLPRLRQMVWHLDDPIGDPITMPNFELAARVSQISPWIYNGEGGDPCFGGPKNLPMMLSHWYGGVSRGPRFREQEYLASYRRGYEELSHLLTEEVRREVNVEEDLEGVLTPFFDCRTPTYFLNKLAAINIRLKGAHLILPKVERMLAASGAIPLSPLFSSDMIRYSFELPPRMKLHGGNEKVVLKQAYRDQLPAEVIDRPKSGMRVPVHFWFQGELKRYARRILNRREIRRAGIFRYDRVKQLLNYSIEEGPGRYGLRLWMLLTFEIWRRIVIENEAV